MKKLALFSLVFAGAGLYAQNQIPTTQVNGSMRIDSVATIHGETTMKDTVHAEKDVKIDGSIYVSGSVNSPVYRVGPNEITSFSQGGLSAINFGTWNNSAPAFPSCVPNWPANGTIAANRLIIKDQAGVNSLVFDFRNEGQNGYIEYPTPNVISDGTPVPHIIKIGSCNNTNVEIGLQAAYTYSNSGFTSMGRNVEIGVPTRTATTALNMNLQAGITKAFTIFNPSLSSTKEIFRVQANAQTTINYGGAYNTPAFIISKAGSTANDASYPPYFVVNGDGKVMISKPSASSDADAITILNPATGQIDYKVKNDGSVYARYMKVTLGNFPDYVFAKGYKIMPLKEVEAYVNANKHLPNIPAAKTVEAEGADLGELQRLNIEKTEEIYLYLIDMNKRLEKLEAENAELKNQLNKK